MTMYVMFYCCLFLFVCDAVSRVPERWTPMQGVRIGNREEPTLGCGGKRAEYGRWGDSTQGRRDVLQIMCTDIRQTDAPSKLRVVIARMLK